MRGMELSVNIELWF